MYFEIESVYNFLNKKESCKVKEKTVKKNYIHKKNNLYH